MAKAIAISITEAILKFIKQLIEAESVLRQNEKLFSKVVEKMEADPNYGAFIRAETKRLQEEYDKALQDIIDELAESMPD